MLGLQDAISSAGLRTTEEAQKAQSKAKDELGQEEFLDLMVAQLRNQDPMKPMENGDFLAQMAQFGTVSGIKDLQDSFNSFSESIHSNQALQAASLVGRSVLAPTGSGVLPAGGSLSGTVELPSSSDNVAVNIHNPAGELVRTIGLGSQASGSVGFQWDGLDNQGEPVAAGQYAVSASATTGSGQTALETLIATPVDNVTLRKDGGLQLGLASGRTLDFSEVRQIR